MPRSLHRILNPASIAVIGGKEAQSVVEQLMGMAYTGDIYPVHPHKETVCGLPVFRSIDALPDSPDAAFVAVNRKRTVSIVNALKHCNTGGVICYASGFTEADDEGKHLQQALIEAAGEMPVIGPNCYGLLNYADGVALWPDQHGGVRLNEGQTGVAIIVQSSNIAINISMQQRGLPVAFVLTAGNQAQTGISEMALNILDHPRVTTLGLHIEGFDSIRGMEAVAAKARELKKPIVAIKIGRSQQAQRAAFTHTAALAGSDTIADAFLRRIGIARVFSIPSFLEALKLLHVCGPLEGGAISSMSCSGGEAGLMADACYRRKLIFPKLPELQKKIVQDALGPRVTVANPLDYHTYIWGDRCGIEAVFLGVLQAGFDFNCLILDFPRGDRCASDDWNTVIDALASAIHQTGAMAAIVTTLPENISEIKAHELISKNLVPLFGIDEALDAIEAAALIGEIWQQPKRDPLAISVIGRDLFSSVPDEAIAKAILSDNGIIVPIGKNSSDPKEIVAAAQVIGYPVVLKALGISHKSERQAVYLNINDSIALALAIKKLKKISTELLLEAMVVDSVLELLIGLSRSEQFGLVMTIATGGTLVEILQDSQTLLLPSSKREIKYALRQLKGAVFFDGFRGGRKADFKAVVNTILAIQKFALANAESLQELDINPLIVCSEGKGAIAADALIKYGS